MKVKGIIAAITMVCIFSASAKAQDYKTALGIRISSNVATVNNSVSFKYFLGGKTAVEALLSFGDPVALGLLVEKHKPLFSNRLNYFYGAGAYIAFGGNQKGGAQGVLGIDYKVPAIPLNFSIDWKPELNVAGDFSFEPKAVAFSARFVFK